MTNNPNMNMAATSGNKVITEEDIAKVVDLACEGYAIEPLFELPKSHRLHPGYSRASFYKRIKDYPHLWKRLQKALDNRVEIYHSRALDNARKAFVEARSANVRIRKARRMLLSDPDDKWAKDVLKHDIWIAKQYHNREKHYTNILLRVAAQISGRSMRSARPDAQKEENIQNPTKNSFANVVSMSNRKVN